MGERLLAIDTVTIACSVALFEDGALIASDYAEIGRGHAEKLIPAIAKLPDRGRADKILVNCGPGSFTGVRIGISAAKALALAWGSEIQGYCCLDLVAAQALQKLDRPQSVCVAMLAGHGEYFKISRTKENLSLRLPHSPQNKLQPGSWGVSLPDQPLQNWPQRSELISIFLYCQMPHMSL